MHLFFLPDRAEIARESSKRKGKEQGKKDMQSDTRKGNPGARGGGKRKVSWTAGLLEKRLHVKVQFW